MSRPDEREAAPPAMQRKPSWRPPLRAQVLAEFAECSTVERALRAAGADEVAPLDAVEVKRLQDRMLARPLGPFGPRRIVA